MSKISLDCCKKTQVGVPKTSNYALPSLVGLLSQLTITVTLGKDERN